MVYHSSFNDAQAEQLCGCPLLPVSITAKGQLPETREPDIVDESIYLFKANALFRAFEVKGPADKLLIYLTMYIINCLRRRLFRQQKLINNCNFDVVISQERTLEC